MSENKLRRSSENKKIFGVCGGIAEYFGLDVTVLRVLWVVITFFTADVPGILIYLILALCMPRQD